MSRVVQLIDSKGDLQKCRVLEEMPSEGAIIDQLHIKNIREIHVETDDAKIWFRNPWEFNGFQSYAFFACDCTESTKNSCNSLYFCVKLKYIIVINYAEAAPEMIADSATVLTPEELKAAYSDWLTCSEDTLQVIDENDNVLSEYRPA